MTAWKQIYFLFIISEKLNPKTGDAVFGETHNEVPKFHELFMLKRENIMCSMASCNNVGTIKKIKQHIIFESAPAATCEKYKIHTIYKNY